TRAQLEEIARVKMPDLNGIDVVKRVRELEAGAVVIILTAYGSIESAVEAMRQGADDYLSKPFENRHLCHVVSRVLERSRLLRENSALRLSLARSSGGGRILGTSQVMLDLLDLIQRAAATDSNVLILGESGTGKELVARRLHALSRRCGHPFVPLDCTAVPETLLESELFGHEKGAFTGAGGRRMGLVESAASGTLFLDEIGELSVGLQAKLLRVLEERRVRRIGGREQIPVDVRVVAATHVDLPSAVSSGRFRQDLYFRLNVIPIRLPPLRQRPEDIPLLVEAFQKEFSVRCEKPPTHLAAEVLSLLEQYAWPGNVRELRNVMERMVSLARSEEIGMEDVPAEIQTSGELSTAPALGTAFRQAKRRTVARFEWDYLHRHLVANQGNVTRAARAAGLNRSAFQRLMRRHELRSEMYRKQVPQN
ncbi:MAG: sigma-54-dependent transcriptional regulator, partial [Acidobacteriota bacterium]